MNKKIPLGPTDMEAVTEGGSELMMTPVAT